MYAQPRYGTQTGAFPKRADKKRISQFSTVKKNLIQVAITYRAYADWATVIDDMTEPQRVAHLAQKVIDQYPHMLKTLKSARQLADAHPRSDAARVLREMLTLADADLTTRPDYLKQLKADTAKLKRKYK